MHRYYSRRGSSPSSSSSSLSSQKDSALNYCRLKRRKMQIRNPQDQEMKMELLKHADKGDTRRTENIDATFDTDHSKVSMMICDDTTTSGRNDSYRSSTYTTSTRGLFSRSNGAPRTANRHVTWQSSVAPQPTATNNNGHPSPSSLILSPPIPHRVTRIKKTTTRRSNNSSSTLHMGPHNGSPYYHQRICDELLSPRDL